MKKTNKSNLSNSLQTIGIVGLLLFAMAFACNDDTQNGSKPTTKTGGGRCSTKVEFQNIIQKDFHLGTFGEAYGEYKDSEINFHTFDISAPTAYTAAEAGHLVKVDTAYPISTEYTTRHYKHDGTRDVNETWEYDWKSDFVCYINHRDECVCDRKKYESSDKRVTPID